MRYSVLTPTDFDADERLPLVIFLHGGGDDEASFDRAGLSAQLTEAMTERRIPRMVIALPQGDLGFWADWYDGSRHYESWVTREVLPHVHYDYHTLPCPDACHVMGVSMGGSGAIRFALHRPDLFHSASFLSAPILDTEGMIQLAATPLLVPIIPMERIFGPLDPRTRVAADDPYLRWTRSNYTTLPQLLVAWATNDRGGIVETSARFVAHLQHENIPHQTFTFPGNHSWVSWRPAIERALGLMVERSAWEHPLQPAHTSANGHNTAL